MAAGAQHHAREIAEQGYTVLERTHEPEALERLTKIIQQILEDTGLERPYAAVPRELSKNLVVNPTGLAIFQLVKLAPEAAPLLFSSHLLEAARAALGDDMFLELTGGSVSDASRPFFTWHHHIGGIDVEGVRQRGELPRLQHCERLIAVTYLHEIDAEGGELLAIPRRLGDPMDPRGDERDPDWPGAVTIRFPRGSTLVFEQSTWHAVRPMQRPGLRMFVGGYFTAQRAPRTELVDESLDGFAGGGSDFQQLLAQRPRR
ncbi:MAG: hypothetical protein R3B07_17370 [Polyangiaceae bacterium]